MQDVQRRNARADGSGALEGSRAAVCASSYYSTSSVGLCACACCSEIQACAAALSAAAAVRLAVQETAVVRATCAVASWLACFVFRAKPREGLALSARLGLARAHAVRALAT